MSEYMYTIREMAKIMETSPAGLKTMRGQNAGPRHMVIAGRVFYPESSLATWKRICEQASVSPSQPARKAIS